MHATQARDCIQIFPVRVTELNKIIVDYEPTGKLHDKGQPFKHQLSRSSTSIARAARGATDVHGSSTQLNSKKKCSLCQGDDSQDNFRCFKKLLSFFSLHSVRSSHSGTAASNRARHRNAGICKSKYYRQRGVNGTTVRRRPGPLGQILGFIFGKLAICTRTMVIAPSWYIVDSLMSVLFKR